MMVPLPMGPRILLGIIAAIAGILAALLGNALWPSITYWLTKRGRYYRRPLRLWVLFCFSAFISVVFGAYASFAPEPEDVCLYNTQIEGSGETTIVAYNRRGAPIWQVELGSKTVKAVVDDVDQNGRQEVVVATSEPGSRPGWLLAFDEEGNLLDEHNIWKPSIYLGGAKQQSNVADFLVVDLTNDGTKEIVVISRDVYWYASKLSVLQFRESKFSEMTEYWNPGLLYTLHIADVNDDQIQEIVCTGVNNDLQSVLPLDSNVYSVFLLAGSAIYGQAPPWFGDAPKGSEIWYGYVMPPSVRVSEVDFEDVNGDGVAEIHVALSDACSYYLNHEGDVVRQGRGSACKNESDLQILQISE